MLNVSVVVPTYNRKDYLLEAIQSIIDQTAPAFQIIVVDDGSTDGTRVALGPFLDRIEYVRKENGGKSAALNLGLSHVRGDAVWIFDDDDVAELDALEIMGRELLRNPDAGLVHAKHGEFHIDQAGTRHAKLRDDALDDGLHWVALHRCAVFQGAMLVRTECYRAVGAFDETLIRAQDYDMLLRLARRFRGIELNDVVFHQRMHPGTRGSAASPVRRQEQYRTQRRYEQMIFRRVHADYALREYGRVGHLTGVRSRVDLLCERATVMGRKGLWDLAEQDMRSALLIATLSGLPEWPARCQDTLACMFDETSVGLSEFVKAASFHKLLRESWYSPLTQTMCRIFSASLQARVRRALLGHRSYHAASLTAALSCIVFARFTSVTALCRLLLGASDAARHAGEAAPRFGPREGAA